MVSGYREKSKERLESIKKVHSQKNTIFTSRMEDYLEVISELIDLKGYAIPTDISTYMHVSAPSVTKMLKKLHELGYVTYTKYRGLSLNPTGKRLSNKIRQKHSDLLEFLVMIGVDQTIANQDVEGIEHHLNSKTMRKVRKFTSYLKSNPDLLVLFKKS